MLHMPSLTNGWVLRDSNSRPKPCKGLALPAELSTRKNLFMILLRARSLRRAVLGILTYEVYAPVPVLRRAGRSRSASLCDGGDPGAAHCPPGWRAACGPLQQTDPASRASRAAFRRALQGFQALVTDREQVLRRMVQSEGVLPLLQPQV